MKGEEFLVLGVGFPLARLRNRPSAALGNRPSTSLRNRWREEKLRS